MTTEECNHDFDYFQEMKDLSTGKTFIVSYCKYCHEEREDDWEDNG